MCKIIFQPYSIILDSSLKNGNRFYSRDRHLNPLIKKSVAIDNQSRYFEAFIKCSALIWISFCNLRAATHLAHKTSNFRLWTRSCKSNYFLASLAINTRRDTNLCETNGETKACTLGILIGRSPPPPPRPIWELLGDGRKFLGTDGSDLSPEPSSHARLKEGSKLSSWFPATTILCGCGRVDNQVLNSRTCSNFQYRLQRVSQGGIDCTWVRTVRDGDWNRLRSIQVIIFSPPLCFRIWWSPLHGWICLHLVWPVSCGTSGSACR